VRQAIHFDLLNATVAPDRIEATLHQLNNILPSDVRVYNLELAPAATFVDALQVGRERALLPAKEPYCQQKSPTASKRALLPAKEPC